MRTKICFALLRLAVWQMVTGVHGRWKRIEQDKPSLKLQPLNGILKVHYAIFNDGGTDDVDALLPHFQLWRSAHRREYEAVCNLGEVPSGMRQGAIYLQRFNLHAPQSIFTSWRHRAR